MTESMNLISAAAILIAGAISSAWCVIQASTIGASERVERNEISIWGRVLLVMGFMIMVLGVVSSLVILMPEILGILIIITAQTLFAAAVLIISVLVGFGGKTLVTSFFGVLGIPPILSFSLSGGDVGVIPPEVWLALFGALTMIGSAICAAVCIMSAVKAGSEAMKEKPELSIWSLLFVALGEGLAIYGLIVAILLIM
jgi:V/A-type H+-transporting ATPase subunit K